MNTVADTPVLTRGKSVTLAPDEWPQDIPVHSEPSLLKKITHYQHPTLVTRLQEKLGLSQEEALLLFEDTKRFLYLCAQSSEILSPNETLDFGWHEFILFMRDYEDFCQKHFGRTIYHRPHHPSDQPAKGEGGRRTLALARRVFGENLSKNWNCPCLNESAGGPCDNCGCSPNTCDDG